MPSSTVSAATSRYTITGRSWPIRCARSAAWSSTAGFHQGSSRNTWSAWVRFKPVPPARSETSRTGGPASCWKARHHPGAVDGGAIEAGVVDAGGREARLHQVQERGPLREHQGLVAVGDHALQLLKQEHGLGGGGR